MLKPYFFIVSLSIVFLNGCSTQVEERASLDFTTSQPVELAEAKDVSKTGSIYSEDKGGLFATDRRASKIGDILTVALSESDWERESRNVRKG